MEHISTTNCILRAKETSQTNNAIVNIDLANKFPQLYYVVVCKYILYT